MLGLLRREVIQLVERCGAWFIFTWIIPSLVAAWLHSGYTSIIRGRDGAGRSREIRAAQAVLLNEKMQPV